MIEVNLLPGGKKRKARRSGFSLPLPQVKGVPKDKWILGSTVVLVLVVSVAGRFWFSAKDRKSELEGALEVAVADSVRYADLIDKTQTLAARRDSIAEKVAIIQGIDAQRYVWAHLMDEVARSLPDYTWLTNIIQVTSGQPMQFRIEGKAGNNFALTRFWNNLEESHFIRNVRLITTEQTIEQLGRGSDQGVYQFTLEADLEDPPADLLEMVPLLGAQAGLQQVDQLDDPEDQVASPPDDESVAGPAGVDRP